MQVFTIMRSKVARSAQRKDGASGSCKGNQGAENERALHREDLYLSNRVLSVGVNRDKARSRCGLSEVVRNNRRMELYSSREQKLLKERQSIDLAEGKSVVVATAISCFCC